MKRRKLSSEKKVEILREHLDNKVSISELSEKYGIHPNLISRWKKDLFENAVNIFSQKKGKTNSTADKKISKLEETLQIRDSLIAELVSENIQLKKKENGET